MGDPERIKTVTRVIPKLTGTSGTVVSVRVGTQMTPSDDITWATTQTYTIGTSKQIDALVTGKLISFEFTSTDDTPFTLSGWDIEYQLGGYF